MSKSQMVFVPLALAALWLLVLLGGSCVASSTPPVPRPAPGDAVAAATGIEAALDSLRRIHGVPALGAAVVAGGKLVDMAVVGERVAGSGVAATSSDLWHLGSCTKAMTATLIGVLVEDGVLGWDEQLSSLFPGWDLDPRYVGVTMAQLLSHRGGTPPDLKSLPEIWGPLWEPGDPRAQRRWFAERILKAPPTQPPGSYAYSNAGYMIAAAALELRTGKSWEVLLRTKVFARLGMDSCGFGPAASPGKKDQPWGHASRGGRLTPVESGPKADNPPALGPAGTVHCSLADWGAFAAAHLEGARGESTWLSAETWTRLHSPTDGSYALGWMVVDRDWAGGRALTHAGSNTMNYAVIWIAPEIDKAFLSVTNSGDGFQAVDATIAALIERRAD